jgi:hypothetical protein
MNVKLDNYVPVKAAAAFLGVKPENLVQWANRNMIKHYKHPVTKRNMFLKTDLEDILKNIKFVED